MLHPAARGRPAREGHTGTMVREVFRFRGRGRRGGATNAILTERQHELLAEELALLERLAALLDEYPGTEVPGAMVNPERGR